MYDEALSKYGFIPMNHQAPQFFPVEAGPIYDDKGQQIHGHQRIYRGDSGDTLAVHTSKYTMVPYERHFALFEDAIAKSDLDKTGMMVGTDMSDNGARIFRQYLFPAANVEIVDRLGQSNRMALRIIMFDSYNGSSAFIGKSGYFNFICANTAIFGKSLLDVRYKHTGAMEEKVAEAAQQLVGAAETFIRETNRMLKWPEIDLPVPTFSDVLASLPQHNARLVNELVAEYARGDDHSLWGANQLLTSWATHDLHKSRLPLKTQADRQKRVSDLVESVDWVEIENRV
jgi:hypothetical protein